MASCTSTSTLILMLGLGARFVVPKLAEMNPLTLGLIKDGVDWKHACLASALAVGVTAGGESLLCPHRRISGRRRMIRTNKF